MKTQKIMIFRDGPQDKPALVNTTDLPFYEQQYSNSPGVFL